MADNISCTAMGIAKYNNAKAIAFIFFIHFPFSPYKRNHSRPAGHSSSYVIGFFYASIFSLPPMYG